MVSHPGGAMRTILLFCVSVILGVDATLKKDGDGKYIGGKHAIKSTCKKDLKTWILVPCVRNVVPTKKKDHLRLSYKEYEWEVLEAEEGGYHIRHCEKNDTTEEDECVYWKDTHYNGWDYLVLSHKPESRFQFKEVGEILHEKWRHGGRVVGSVAYPPHTVRTNQRPLEGTAYQIISLDSKDYNYITFYTQNKVWIIKDHKTWNWIFDPPLEK